MPIDKAKLDQTEAAGQKRFGDSWSTAINYLGRQTGGIPENDMDAILRQQDPAQTIFGAGREAILKAISSGDKNDKDAEEAYSEIRAKERAAHAKMKGRR